MTRRSLRWLVGVTAFAIAGCARDPHALAGEISGLEVPKTAPVDSLLDRPSGMLDQDLEVYVALRLTEAETLALIAAAQNAGFVRVDRRTDDLLARPDSVNQFGLAEHGWADAANDLRSDGVGFWRFRRESPSSSSSTMIDSTGRRL